MDNHWEVIDLKEAAEHSEELTAQDLIPGMRIEDIPAVFDCKTLARILAVGEGIARTVMTRDDFPVFIITYHCHRIYKVPFLKWLEEQCKPRGQQKGA